MSHIARLAAEMLIGPLGLRGIQADSLSEAQADRMVAIRTAARLDHPAQAA